MAEGNPRAAAEELLHEKALTPNVHFHKCLRFFELTMLIIGTSVCYGSGMWVIDKLREQIVMEPADSALMTSVIVSLITVTIFTFYNILLFNIRFWMKVQCTTAGMCIYDAFNYIFCFCCFQKFCLEGQEKTISRIGSIVKFFWVLAVAFWTLGHCQDKQEFWDNEFEVGQIYHGQTRFHVYMMLYALQPLIWPVFHVVCWPVFALLTCYWNEWENEYQGNLDQQIWSYKYIDYELGRLDNFANHVVGPAELRFHRDLRFVRRQVTQRQQQQQ